MKNDLSETGSRETESSKMQSSVQSQRESLDKFISGDKSFQELNEKYERWKTYKYFTFGVMASTAVLSIAAPAILYLTGQYDADLAIGSAGIAVMLELISFVQINSFLDARDSSLRLDIMLKRGDLKKEKTAAEGYQHLEDGASSSEEISGKFNNNIENNKGEM